MKSYYRLMLGAASAHAAEALAGSFVGVDFEIAQDLSSKLPEDFRAFNEEFIPVYLAGHTGKSKIGAGLACGALWSVSKGFNIGDVVLSPDGTGRYMVGEIVGPYSYVSAGPLPHRRSVSWSDQLISRSDMSQPLKRSTGSIGTLSNISRHREEVESLLLGMIVPPVVATDPSVEDPAAFVMESHLEDFLVLNWKHTELGKDFDIYEENGEQVGQQYMTDTGPLDVLAISKDKAQLLVVELKKGRASDAVVGQTMRYMGYVQAVLAEPGQSVRGAIVALEDDQRIRRALSVAPSISFYRYRIDFKLQKSD